MIVKKDYVKNISRCQNKKSYACVRLKPRGPNPRVRTLDQSEVSRGHQLGKICLTIKYIYIYIESKCLGFRV